MLPVHQFDMYPHQRNQMQSAPQHYPGFEAIPPQMRADPDRVYYPSWPWSSSYGCAYPSQCHGCCGHSHFAGCNGWRSPYAQLPPVHYHGSYPTPPGAYPIHYIPPPHHTAEMPCYDYHKDVNGYYHCCGCSNHPCNQNVGKNVKIEEEGSHSESKVNESLVPFNLSSYPNPLVWYAPNNIKNEFDNRSSEPQYGKQEGGSRGAKVNYPYPILWFPPNYVVNSEDKKSNEPQHKKPEDDTSSANDNYQYPVLWFPPTDVKNKEGVSNEPEYEKQERSSNGLRTREMSKPLEQQQNFMDGWFPFDMNNLRPPKNQSLRQQSQQQGDDKLGFTCPVFWMPYEADEGEHKGHKRTGVDPECAQRAPSNLEVSPVVLPETRGNNDMEMNNQVIGDKVQKQTEKTGVPKTIPVMQAGLDEEEKSKGKTKSSGMQLKGGEARKSSDDGDKRKSPSPPKSSEDGSKKKSPSSPKSSKLPPVCLRVDPLPKRKNANGSSRSPSPPGDKGKSREVHSENVKQATSMDTKDSMPQRTKDKEQNKSKIRTIQVSEGTGSQDRNSDSMPGSQTNDTPREALEELAAPDLKSVAGTNDEEAAVGDISIPSSCQIDGKIKKCEEEEKAASKAKESRRKTLSEAEAASIIQAAYRGYEVRRWEPLKKLKQIMEVSDKVAELKSSIQACELSPNVQDFNKWRVVTGETIMHLLLKLDTIQGMHTSIRDVRKAVARELVNLQEKVDQLAQKKSETLTQQAPPVLFGENMDNGGSICIREGQEEKQKQQSNGLETCPVNEFHEEMFCKEEHSPRHAATNSGKLDIPGIINDADVNPQEPTTEARNTETELHQGDHRMDAVPNSQDPDIPETVLDEVEKRGEQIKEANNAETELERNLRIPEVHVPAVDPLPAGTCSLQGTDASTLGDLEEFPKGELNEDICVRDNFAQKEVGKETALEGAVLMNELPKGLQDIGILNNGLLKNDEEKNDALAESYPESKELEELPLGVLDEDAVDDSNSDKHVHIEEDDRGKSNPSAVVPGGRVLNMNQAEKEQERIPVTSEVDENLACTEDEGSKAELFNMVDVGLNNLLQAPNREITVEIKSVNESEVHDREGPGTKANDVYGNRSGVTGYYAEVNDTPAVIPTPKQKEASETGLEEASELSSVEGGNEFTWSASSPADENNSSSEDAPQVSETCDMEDREKDVNNSSSKDAPQEYDLSQKLSEIGYEDEEKQLSGNLEQPASEGACDSGASETELMDKVEFIPLEAKQTEEQEIPPSSPTASQISVGSDALSEVDKKLIEENIRLREMMQKLIEAGQEQLTAISNLSTKVKDLEKRISKKKKLKLKRNGSSRLSSGSCLKPSGDSLKEKAVALAM